MKDRYHFDEELKIKEINAHVAFDEFVLGTKPDEKIAARREARLAKVNNNSKLVSTEDVEKAKRKKKKHIRVNRLIFAIAVLAFVVVFVVIAGVKLMNLQIEKRNAEKQLEALKEQAESLTDELQELDTDEYIENAARSELHMIKDGEVMYIVNPELGDEEEENEIKTK